jgi:site-specific recombinase XerD
VSYEDHSLSPKTQAEYRRDVAAFIAYLDGKPVSPSALAAYRDSLLASGRAASGVNRALAAIRSSLKGIAHETLSGREAAAVGAILAEVKGAKKVVAAIGSERMLKPEELAALKKAASVRLRLVIDFLRVTGTRVSEACGIHLAECTERGELVFIRVLGKGNKERTVRIGRALFEDICTEYRGSLYLFETRGGKPLRREYVTHEIAKVSRRAIGRATFAHALRHTIASETIKSGKIQGTSLYLGHSDPAITLRYYVHESLDDADLGL